MIARRSIPPPPSPLLPVGEEGKSEPRIAPGGVEMHTPNDLVSVQLLSHVFHVSVVLLYQRSHDAVTEWSTDMTSLIPSNDMII